MTNVKVFVLILILITIFCFNVYSEEGSDSFFEEGSRLAGEYKYIDAIKQFSNALQLEKKKSTPRIIFVINTLNQIGSMYYYLSDYPQSLIYYKEALILAEKNENIQGMAGGYNNIAMIYYLSGKYESALDYYQKSLAISKRLNLNEGIIVSLVNLAGVYNVKKEYGKAFSMYKEGLQIAERLTNKMYSAEIYNGIGRFYSNTHQYDKAINYYNKAMGVFKSYNLKNKLIESYYNLGSVFFFWGKRETALINFNKALALSKEIATKNMSSLLLDYVGRYYLGTGNYETAITKFNKSLKIAIELNRKNDEATAFNSLGMAYFLWQKFDKAEEFFKRSLSLASIIKTPSLIAQIYIHLGGIKEVKGNYKESLNYYTKALHILTESKNQVDLAVCFHNIGTIYINLKQYDKSEEFFLKSIKIKESLRLTATGAYRRDYLESQLNTYKYLIQSYMYQKKYSKAFNTIELSTSKYLVEQMTERISAKTFTFQGIERIQKSINHKTAIITYSGILWQESFQIFVDHEKLKGFKKNTIEFIDALQIKNYSEIEKVYNNLRGVKFKESNKNKKTYTFVIIINYYRYLLSKPDLTNSEKEIMQDISKKLYQLLISSSEQYLNNKNTLIIIPEGILGFIPFETLIMPDGRYLIEKYHIKYSQSMTVYELINKRKYSSYKKKSTCFWRSNI